MCKDDSIIRISELCQEEWNDKMKKTVNDERLLTLILGGKIMMSVLYLRAGHMRMRVLHL